MSRYYNDPQEGLIPTSGYIIDTENQTTTFTSSDVANTSDATSWTAVSKLNSGETHKSIFAKVSQMFKNVRFLYKMLGTTDISAIGDGTVTGGLSNLKSSLTTDSEWTTLNSSYYCGYRKYNGLVFVRVYVQNKNVAIDFNFGTLPAGYRPVGNMRVTNYSGTGGLSIGVDGKVTWVNTATDYAICMVIYPPEN